MDCSLTDCNQESPYVNGQALPSMGILQVRILELVAMAFSGESYRPCDHLLHWQAGSLRLVSLTLKNIKVINDLSALCCSIQFSSVAQLCPTLCDPMNCSMPGLPVHHQLPEFTQTHVHRVSDAIQPSHPLSSPSHPAPNPSQHQSLFQ